MKKRIKEIKLTNLQVFYFSIISILSCALIIDFFFRKSGFVGMIIGILLFIWLRFLYDKLPEEKNGDKNEKKA